MQSLVKKLSFSWPSFSKLQVIRTLEPAQCLSPPSSKAVVLKRSLSNIRCTTYAIWIQYDPQGRDMNFRGNPVCRGSTGSTTSFPILSNSNIFQSIFISNTRKTLVPMNSPPSRPGRWPWPMIGRWSSVIPVGWPRWNLIIFVCQICVKYVSNICRNPKSCQSHPQVFPKKTLFFLYQRKSEPLFLRWNVVSRPWVPAHEDLWSQCCCESRTWAVDGEGIMTSRWKPRKKWRNHQGTWEHWQHPWSPAGR